MKDRIYNWSIPVLLFLLLLPLFVLNITGLHAWGGDFSQYIHQAINIVDNKPIADIGYVYNSNHPSLAPSAYPAGFPMMLAPVYALFGNDMTVFMTFVAFLLFLMGGLFFYFIKQEFGVLAAFLGTLILVYNPWTIEFKVHVLSDIPFTLFAILSAFTYVYWKNKRMAVVIGCIVGFTMLIRSMGIVLIIAIVLDKLLKIGLLYRKNNSDEAIKKEVKDGLMITITAILVVNLIHQVIFPLPKENDYTAIINSKTKFDYLWRNFYHYWDLFYAYFTIGSKSWLSIVSTWIFGLLALVGMVFQKQKSIVFLLIGLGLFGVVLLFPYLSMFRYVYPVVPFLIYFFFTGCKKLFAKSGYYKTFIGVYFLTCLFLYLPDIIQYQKKIDAYPLTSGPQQEVSVEAFQYVKDNTPEDALMVFQKPRVLSLYADRKCMRNSYRGPDVIHKKFLEQNIDYILQNLWIAKEDTPLDVYIKKYGEQHLDSIWSNSRYVLYQFEKGESTD